MELGLENFVNRIGRPAVAGLAAVAVGVSVAACGGESIITIPPTAQKLGKMDKYDIGFAFTPSNREDAFKVHCDSVNEGRQVTVRQDGTTVVECVGYSGSEKIIVK